ncbi:MAG: hypothetical protein Q9208_005345 [Pyrenodesmia sp. 3 TL-2023]
MPKKKSPEDFFQRAREKGFNINKTIVNGTVVKKHLEPKTEKNYAGTVPLEWDFAREIAYGIDGIYHDPTAGEKTVLQYWKGFTAGWRRHTSLIPPETTQSVTNFIKIPRREELGLAHRKRLRCYGTTNHFIHMGTQLWEKDWQIYEKPRIRVDTWAINPALRVYFGKVFRNEHGKAEFAIQVVRDAKNKTLTPEKRAIADHAFRDYSTMEELLEIEPPEHETYHLRQSDSVLAKPFFQVISSGEMEKAGTLQPASERAGSPCRISPPPDHSRLQGRRPLSHWYVSHVFSIDLFLPLIRAADKLYSTAQRMKHGEHKDERTYCDNYQPNNAGTDLQGGYFDGKLRSLVNDRFRGLTLHRNPELLKQHELEKSLEFTTLENEIKALAPKAKTDPAAKDRRGAPMVEKRKLVSKELLKCQKLQPNKLLSSADDADLMGYHRIQFHRVRCLMPERDRLASSLFLVAPIRSDEGRSVLRDMIALCQQDAEVPFHAGLEPDKCTCLMADHKLDFDRFVTVPPPHLPLTEKATDEARSPQ